MEVSFTHLLERDTQMGNDFYKNKIEACENATALNLVNLV